MISEETKLIILDVGHGNSSILIDDNSSIVIDAPLGPHLIDALRQLKITEIESVLISHADADHLGGMIGLLLASDINIKKVFLNPDASKDTDIWYDFRTAVSVARKKYNTSIHTELTTGLTGNIDLNNVRVQVLWPTPEIALAGAKGFDLNNRPLNSNAISAVIRFLYNERPFALLTGDVEYVGLQNLIEEHENIESEILIFPHHGGLPRGADPTKFTHELCSYVNPSIIIFSIGRGKHNTPRQEILKAIKEKLPKAHIICTQLSEHCATEIPVDEIEHLSNLPAKGRSLNCCCGGTIILTFTESGISVSPSPEKHLEFITDYAPSALCK